MDEQRYFTTDGLLSVGYDYQNMVFAEGYNGPGSPYWAFKTFILLAVPKIILIGKQKHSLLAFQKTLTFTRKSELLSSK